MSLLVWLTQLGLSIAVPLALCVGGAVWLQSRLNLGPWVLAVGIVLGLIGAADGFRSSLRAMERLAKSKKEPPEPPVSFNDHD
ncbi:MAG: AtpZ/AtpI family protein [Firmicutes bacterium]|nr:AtpZ/AtpI family protein [Bacillota bacterium]